MGIISLTLCSSICAADLRKNIAKNNNFAIVYPENSKYQEK